MADRINDGIARGLQDGKLEVIDVGLVFPIDTDPDEYKASLQTFALEEPGYQRAREAATQGVSYDEYELRERLERQVDEKFRALDATRRQLRIAHEKSAECARRLVLDFAKSGIARGFSFHGPEGEDQETYLRRLREETMPRPILTTCEEEGRKSAICPGVGSDARISQGSFSVKLLQLPGALEQCVDYFANLHNRGDLSLLSLAILASPKIRAETSELWPLLNYAHEFVLESFRKDSELWHSYLK